MVDATAQSVGVEHSTDGAVRDEEELDVGLAGARHMFGLGGRDHCLAARPHQVDQALPA